MQKQFDVTEFGASGDWGATDSIAAIQAAVDRAGEFPGGGEVYVPPGSFRITRPIVMRSNVRIYGAGSETLIYNDVPTSRGSGMCFLLGTYDDGGFTDANAIYHDIGAVAKGDSGVTCARAGAAADFSAGDVVYLWSRDGYTATGSYLKPSYQQITEVVGADPRTGVLELRDPAYKTKSANMRISRGGASRGHALNGFTPQMVKNCTIDNLRLRSGSDAWTRFGGFYRCAFRNLWIVEANNAFSTNGAAHCTVENVHATVRARSIELAYFCHDNRIRNFNVTLKPGRVPSQRLGVVSFGEGAHDNEVSGVQADYSDGGRNARGAKFGQGSSRNTVRDLTVRARRLEHLIEAANGHQGSIDYGDNLVDGARFEVDIVSGYAISANAKNPTDTLGIEIRGVRARVGKLETGFIAQKGDGFRMRDCDWSGLPSVPSNSINAASPNVQMTGNRFPAGMRPALAQKNVAATGNTVAGSD